VFTCAAPMASPSKAYGGVDVEADEIEQLYSNSEASTPEVAPRRNLLPKLAIGFALLGAVGVVVGTTAEVEREETRQEFWDRMSDPEELLAYVRMNAPEGAFDDDLTLDDDNFYPMSCAKYDDDTVYPNAVCISGDNSTCHDSSVMSEAYLDACSTACSEGWGVPCGWEAVSDLPSVCNGTFEATFPEDSNNIAPMNVTEVELTINSTQDSYWACNVHAFCFSCVDSDNTVNDFCKAAIIRTKSLYGASAVFKYLDSYWCEEAIIEDIENGTFCGYTADKMSKCEDKNSHARR